MLVWQDAALAVSGGFAVGLGSFVAHRLLRYRNVLRYRNLISAEETLDEVASETQESSLGISTDRYRPMARLLDSQDLKFLASRPGYRPQIGARLRNSRRRIFRMYLSELSGDFQRLHAAARRMAAEAPEQHADLVSMLMRQQVRFWLALIAIEGRLALDWAGVDWTRLAPANAGPLLDMVEQLRQALATGPAPVAAAI